MIRRDRTTIGTKIRINKAVRSKSLGCSLLYFYRESGSLVGVKKSYVLKVDNLRLDDVTRAASDKAQWEITKFSPGYAYIGIEDIYSVVGFANKGSFLGRTSYYEYNKISQGKLLVHNEKHYSASELRLPYIGKYFNVTLVFFYKDIERATDSFTFTAITLVQASDVTTAKIKSNELGASDRFKKRIAGCSIDKLEVEQVFYLGIHDMYPVSDEVKNGGSYQAFYNKKAKSIGELKDQLLSKHELNRKILAIRERTE
jgi:hypothetical protein